MKRPWTDGTTHVLFSPQELIERLVALIPPPRANLVRYHGVLAPNAKRRKSIVPKVKEKRQGSMNINMSWSEMLKRVFEIDATKCQFCGGELKLISTIIDVKTINAILESMKLPAKSPQFKKPSNRDPPKFNQCLFHLEEENQLTSHW